MESTEINTDRSTDKGTDCSDTDLLIESIANRLGTKLQAAADEFSLYERSKLFKSVHDNLKIACKNERRNDKVLEPSNKYKKNRELKKHFSNWIKYRKELIEITKSAAEELDQHLFINNITRTISSLVVMLNSLNLGIYQIFCYSITSYANNVSPALGLIMESILEFAPHLRFMGFVSSFFDILQTQAIINDVVDAIRSDESNYMPIKEWFDETKELDDIVKKLFPYRIDREIIKSIEHDFEGLGKEEKIFSATILSNLTEDPEIHKKGNFMIEAFLFSMSDVAKEWYKRLIIDAYPLDLECERFYIHNELLQMGGVYPDSSSKLELGKCIVDQLEYTITKNTRSNLSRVFILCMSGMSIYYCYENIRTGSKHRYSDKLREFSTNAELFLNTMERIRF